VLKLSDELKGIFNKEINSLEVIARSGQVLIDIQVNVIEEASLLKDLGNQVSYNEELSFNGRSSDSRL
jgi:hypothetical protein